MQKIKEHTLSSEIDTKCTFERHIFWVDGSSSLEGAELKRLWTHRTHWELLLVQ